MTIICIRQPGYLPYIGFFKKIESSDIFVYLDDTKYVKNGWDNRNKIKTDTGSMWLTVPIIRKSKDNLEDVLIENSEEWKNKHLKSIQINYKRTPYFEKYLDSIQKIYDKNWKKLINLNLALIEYFNNQLKIETKTMKSSEMKINSTGPKKLLEICQKLNADTYLSGSSGHDYLDEKIFLDQGIKVIYENFQHPTYNQRGKEFLFNMSIIDLLFNEGDNAKKIILESKNF